MGSPLVSVSMGRANTCPVRKSPILLGSWKNKKILEKQKMMRMSLKKLRKIGDPENLLHRAVLINNTLDYVRKSESNNENTGSACKMNTYDHSNYSPEEEQILNSIRLPVPITPISDAHDVTEDNNENKDNNCDVDVDYGLRTLPNTMTNFTKYEYSTNSDISGSNEQKCQNYISEENLLSDKSMKKISPIY